MRNEKREMGERSMSHRVRVRPYVIAMDLHLIIDSLQDVCALGITPVGGALWG